MRAVGSATLSWTEVRKFIPWNGDEPLKPIKAVIQVNRILGTKDPNLFGQFIEHFDDQIYGGVYNPDSPLSDESGLRMDVTEAIAALNPPVVRWPGGCFVSAYHWEDGVGPERQPSFDKAWRVEDPNTFGTDEFIALCRRIGAEPYICTNAGTGTPEEMSNWVEYCNLRSEGKYARKRIANGHVEPFKVKYWSIGNENYLPGEIGAKTPLEWGVFVRESAKMMNRVDPTIEVLAASVPDLEWNRHLLQEAGSYLDWISIHGYWDERWQNNDLSSYETCMAYSLEIENRIVTTKHMLGAFGYLGKIRIAFDEWNLRGWHHPHVDSATEDYLTPRKLNNRNDSYTMADAVFNACFLNQCLKHCDAVGMANFAPTVNTRGAIYAHENGIVLRSTYFVFQLYGKLLGDRVVDSWLDGNEDFGSVDRKGQAIRVPALDVAATVSSEDESLRLAVVNRHPDKAVPLDLTALGMPGDAASAVLHSIVAPGKDAYNDVHCPDDIRVMERELDLSESGPLAIDIPPHSVHVLVLTPRRS
ncbi:alpha-N-arabinofuranosidase [Paenibacillus sp. B01]|nr:alpha-N-arabinofuranosidase [Paenibacillus sp. B01]